MKIKIRCKEVHDISLIGDPPKRRRKMSHWILGVELKDVKQALGRRQPSIFSKFFLWNIFSNEYIDAR